jgi:hypothetical protein
MGNIIILRSLKKVVVIKKSYLELHFSTPSSLIFSYKYPSISSEIHIHFGTLSVIRITVIITDNRDIKKTKTSLNFINDMMSELSLILSHQTGFFVGNKIELYVSINYNNTRINLAPYILFAGEPRDIMHTDWASTILNNIKSD